MKTKNQNLIVKPALILLSSLSMLPAFASDINDVNIDTGIMDNSKLNVELANNNQAITVDSNFTQALANNIIWHRLLLFNGDANKVKGTSSHSGKSRALDDDFFISPQGKTDPHAELVASLQALNNANTAQDFLCRFPARSHWLMSQIPTLQSQLQSLIGTSSCQKVEDWVQQIDARQISLIHAEEHVNRIGSSLGHTLIRVDTSASLASRNTDDAYFINFATDEQIAKEQGIKSKLNALRGRGIGTMTFGKYTPKQANYLRLDQRDIWQYQLDLSQASVNQIMRHLWEIKSLHRHYNFLTYNCASEILRLMDIALIDDGSMTGNFISTNFMAEAGTVIAPAEVSRLFNKHGLLKNQQFLPALRTVKQKAWNEPNNSSLKNQNNQNTLWKNYEEQAQRGTLPGFTPSDNNPLNANKTHRITVGLKHDGSDNDNTVIIGMRGAYQDFLDSPVGKRDFLNETMMSLSLGYSQDEKDNQSVQLEELILLELLMLNPKNSTLPSASMGGHLKVIPIVDASDSKNEEHRVASIGAEYGSSWLIGKGKQGTGEVPNNICYALADTQAQFGKINKGYRVGLSVHAGCVSYINDKLRVMLDARLPYWYQGVDNDVNGDNIEEYRGHYFQPTVTLAGQYDLANHKAVRASVTQQKNFDNTDTNYMLSYHWFFD